jgi:gamma-glutamyltranspeptidase/glutathione hydrolase
MLHTKRAYNGMVVAPHHLAADAGQRVLREGGNAIEAMIAAASTIAVVYPHMNSLGGDNFWLLCAPGTEPLGIDACGAAAAAADIDFYRSRGLTEIPHRGPLATLTTAGAVSGWQSALAHSTAHWQGQMPLARLLEDAMFHAHYGVAVSDTLANHARSKLGELHKQPGFAGAFLDAGEPPLPGARFKQPALYQTLATLGKNGLDDFYRGVLAQVIAAELADAGSPLSGDDLAAHQAIQLTPMTLQVAGHRLYNMPPPTQGVTSLMLLGVFERLGIAEADTFEFIHGLVEATKQCFRIRDHHVCDPQYMHEPAANFLQPALLDELARGIDMQRAQPWPDAAPGGDTVWLGAIDNQGRAVSFIQSIYWEFGSGVVLPQTGITWQNRGTSFSLDPAHYNCLQPQRRPFHTIQPALALLNDGRVMPYGTMGGDGQPQTQAMVFARHVLHGQPLQASITGPRWLLGRTWGDDVTSLRIENRVPADVVTALQNAGHEVEVIGAFDEVMGHAGALVHHPDGLIEGAADPRSDGAASGL